MVTTVNDIEFPVQCIAPVPFWAHLPGMPAIGAKAFRKRNFAHLVEVVWGGHRPIVADALGFGSPTLVTRYMTTGKSAKPIGDEVARKIEAAAREAGAETIYEGWLDEPHDLAKPPTPPSGKPATIDERINALPEALRRYVLMELDICERVQAVAPTQFMRAPTLQNRRAFQDYLQTVLAQVGGKRTAA